MEKDELKLILLLALFGINYGKLQDEDLTVPELIQYWGYPVVSHEVVTDDGYILTVHRIPHGRSDGQNATGKRPVMFLQHGLLCSSSNWVVNLPNQSLGFLLADAGFDVWMGNVRGNNYSKKHKRYSPKRWTFWQYSFDEHAKYDLPAMVNYALEQSKQKSLYYVGHSMGTMMAFAKLSEDKEFQKKIKVFFALAPVTRLSHMYGPLRLMANFELSFKIMFRVLRIHDFLPSADSLRWLANTACPYHQKLCHRITFVTSSYGLQNFNRTRRPIYLDHTPAGTSVKNMYHFMQLVQERRFQKYDYGFWGNYAKYGKFTPDVYKLSNIENQVVIFYGDSDWLAHPKDVKWLTKQLPNIIENVMVSDYNHLDFVWGLNAKEEIYDKIITMAKQLEEESSNQIHHVVSELLL